MIIRKAVFPVAGFGTRLLPATKSIPKEMLPIVDKPTIQYVVEEAVASGITDIIFVTGRGKRAIEDHFDRTPELEAHFAAKGDDEAVAALRGLSEMVNVASVRQKEMRGLGHAILAARDLVGHEPFAVLLGDDLIQAERPCLRQLLDVHEAREGGVLALFEAPREQSRLYGMAGGDQVDERTYRLREVVEKPAPAEAPSTLAIMGRYVLPPRIFAILERTPPGRNGEVQLTDAIAMLMREEAVYGYVVEGDRFDAGDKLGLLKTTIAFALRRPDIAPGLRAYLRGLDL